MDDVRPVSDSDNLEGPVWRRSPIGSDAGRNAGIRGRRPTFAVVGVAAVLLLGSTIALGSHGTAATNRAAASEGSVQIGLTQPKVDTVVSDGGTDHSELGRSVNGNAALLIATATATLSPTDAITLAPTNTPTAEQIAPVDIAPTAEVLSETSDVSVTVIGDSIVLSTATDLKAGIPNLDLFAQVGLQVSGGIEALQERAEANSLGETVLIDLGNNGTFTSTQFDQIMTLVGPERRVFFVNLNISRAWRDANNELLAQKVAQYSNASLLDWYGTSLDHPEYFASDRVHLVPEGVEVLSSLLLGALG
jgi:hypothetical protein